MNTSPRKPLFSMGSVVATPASLQLLEKHQLLPLRVLARHLDGDWGDLDTADKNANNEALSIGGRLLSVYVVGGERVWIITEADRSATTLLLPSEY